MYAMLRWHIFSCYSFILSISIMQNMQYRNRKVVLRKLHLTQIRILVTIKIIRNLKLNHYYFIHPFSFLYPRRESNTTDEIVSCSADINACNGDEDHNYCKVGYIGPLCKTCDNYGEMWG